MFEQLKVQEFRDGTSALASSPINYLPSKLGPVPEYSSAEIGVTLERHLPTQSFLTPDYREVATDQAIWGVPENQRLRLPKPWSLRFSPDGSRLLIVGVQDRLEQGICYETIHGKLVGIVKSLQPTRPDQQSLLPHNSKTILSTWQGDGFQGHTVAFSDDGDCYVGEEAPWSDRYAVWKRNETRSWVSLASLETESQVRQVALTGCGKVASVLESNRLTVLRCMDSSQEYAIVVSLAADELDSGMSFSSFALTESGDLGILATDAGTLYKLQIPSAVHRRKLLHRGLRYRTKTSVLFRVDSEITQLTASSRRGEVLWADDKNDVHKYTRGDDIKTIDYGPRDENDQVASVCLSRNGDHVAWTCDDGATWGWNRKSGEHIRLDPEVDGNRRLGTPLRRKFIIDNDGESRSSHELAAPNDGVGWDSFSSDQSEDCTSRFVDPVTSIAIMDAGKTCLATLASGGFRCISSKQPDGGPLFFESRKVRFSGSGNLILHYNDPVVEEQIMLPVCGQYVAVFKVPGSGREAVPFKIQNPSEVRAAGMIPNHSAVENCCLEKSIVSSNGQIVVLDSIIKHKEKRLRCVVRNDRRSQRRDVYAGFKLEEKQAAGISNNGCVIAQAKGRTIDVMRLIHPLSTEEFTAHDFGRTGWQSVDFRSGEVRAYETDCIVTAICLSPSGDQAVVAEANGKFSFWILANGEVTHSYLWPNGYVTALSTVEGLPLLGIGDSYGNLGLYSLEMNRFSFGEPSGR